MPENVNRGKVCIFLSAKCKNVQRGCVVITTDLIYLKEKKQEGLMQIHLPFLIRFPFRHVILEVSGRTQHRPYSLAMKEFLPNVL